MNITIQNLSVASIVITNLIVGGTIPEDTPIIVFPNFKIVGNFAAAGIVDEASFINYLQTESSMTTSVPVISGFSIVGDVLECNLQAEGSYLNLSSLGLTAFEGDLNSIVGLESINLQNNNITLLSENLILPSTVNHFSLVGNSNFTEASYIASEPFANNLHVAPSQNSEFNFNLTGFSPQQTNFGQILLSKSWVLTDITR